MPYLLLALLWAPLALGADTDNLAVSARQKAALSIAVAPLSAHAGAASTGLPARVGLPPDAERVVGAPVAGLVSSLNKNAGDKVAAGEALATLVSPQLLETQHALVIADSTRRLAADNAARDEALFAEGIIAESRLRESRAKLAQGRAEVAALSATLRLQGLSARDIEAIAAGQVLRDSVAVRAPLAGQILERLAETGERVEAGMPLYRLARMDRLLLEIDVPVELARTLKPGMAVKVPGTQAAGRITAIEAGVGSAQTVTVRANLDAAHGLRPGQAVGVRIAELEAAGRWRVPAAALAWVKGRPHVFVETPQGFRVMPVAVLSQSAGGASIAGTGLRGDERIAVTGVAALKALWQGGGE
jgi:RND family efflux transporter MFP subunit